MEDYSNHLNFGSFRVLAARLRVLMKQLLPVPKLDHAAMTRHKLRVKCLVCRTVAKMPLERKAIRSVHLVLIAVACFDHCLACLLMKGEERLTSKLCLICSFVKSDPKVGHITLWFHLIWEARFHRQALVPLLVFAIAFQQERNYCGQSVLPCSRCYTQFRRKGFLKKVH